MIDLTASGVAIEVPDFGINPTPTARPLLSEKTKRQDWVEETARTKVNID